MREPPFFMDFSASEAGFLGDFHGFYVIINGGIVRGNPASYARRNRK
jgi:hypothetical protein